jgi:probable HAF family extracellular repeat protein
MTTPSLCGSTALVGGGEELEAAMVPGLFELVPDLALRPRRDAPRVVVGGEEGVRGVERECECAHEHLRDDERLLVSILAADGGGRAFEPFATVKVSAHAPSSSKRSFASGERDSVACVHGCGARLFHHFAKGRGTQPAVALRRSKSMTVQILQNGRTAVSIGLIALSVGCSANTEESTERKSEPSATATETHDILVGDRTRKQLASARVPSAPPARYVVSEVPTLGGPGSSASDVSGTGTVVGSADLPALNVHAVMFASGVLTDLGTLGGNSSIASGTNAHGLVVGSADTSEGRNQAFVYEGGSMVNLGGTFLGSAAQKVNNKDQIVGNAIDSAGSAQAVLWQRAPGDGDGKDSSPPCGPWVATELGDTIIAADINDRGDIAGTVVTPAGLHAMVLRDGTIVDLGTGGAAASEGRAINNAGDVAGSTTNPDHAAVWHAGDFRDLGTLGGALSIAFDIDDAGNVVGAANDASNASTTRAFLYTAGTMIDLNTRIDPNAGWLLFTARAIAPNGTIVGFGMHDGQFRGFILTPVRAG